MISLISVGIGYVAGAFTPGILRKVKSLFVKEAAVVKSAATSVAPVAKAIDTVSKL